MNHLKKDLRFYQNYTILSKNKEKYAKNVNIKIHFSNKIVRNVILNMEAKHGQREIPNNKFMDVINKLDLMIIKIRIKICLVNKDIK